MEIYDALAKVPPKPGKYIVRLPVTTGIDGTEVVVWMHALVGSKPGPTLTVLSGLHGNEWLHLHFFRSLQQNFDAAQVAGRVLVVPMANTVAFGTLSRDAGEDAESADANRAFPAGPGRRSNWVSEQIATTIATEILPATNALLDFHLGVWGHAMGSVIVGTDFSRPEVNERSFGLALSFGSPLIQAIKMVGAWPGPRTAVTYAAEILGIPGCGSFLGGAGFDRDLEKSWHDGNLRGIHNAMKYLGMEAGKPSLPERYLVWDTAHRLNPRVGGLLAPTNEVESLGREVRQGEILGRVTSPFTFETLEELKSPADGYLSYWSRSCPIHPGGWAYGVIPKDHAGNRWMPRPDKI